MTEKTTEKDSNYNHLEKMSVFDLLHHINTEDKKVPVAIEKILHRIETVVILITQKMREGGRLFYIGAGTSGRLGVLDASELPPTFGLEPGRVIALISGGDAAIRKAVEFAEDDTEAGWNDLKKFDITRKDVVIGIAASGTTPYVLGAMKSCVENEILCIAITCNKNSPLSKVAHYPIEVIVGPEFVTGSTRMKSGTAQKLVLNMISTAVMIQLGKVKGNKMVDMQLTNNKLISRGTKMLMSELDITAEEANRLLLEFGSVRKVLEEKRKSE
ncbi:MAG: N-acetylmuramic acid 6-phosphate etherase [Bacteroidetes bacterium]|nr:N-acetylmuramic acid 6-phosphate etherase [Bacteroidota bacterium]